MKEPIYFPPLLSLSLSLLVSFFITMKFQDSEHHPFGNTTMTSKHMIPKLTLLAIMVILTLAISPLWYPFCSYHSSSVLKMKHIDDDDDNDAMAEKLPSTYVEKCDIFTGEWVPNPKAPYYTNKTCWAIHEHQNCMKYGRPDSEFIKWRWKPSDCELPIFNPFQFLEIVKGKSMAFVGDSVGRNQMQSMICLLSRVSTNTTTTLFQYLQISKISASTIIYLY